MRAKRAAEPRRPKPARTRVEAAKARGTGKANGRAISPAAEPASAREIYAVVRAIPRGKVATYGQIGELIGIPAGHRVVARAMRSCPEDLPWHRVVGKKDARRAQISVQDPGHIALQRKLLAGEGVAFDAGGFIPLKISGWLPA
jgi:methylated-DNA-protein-cysteine methyltransferase-like protein